MKKTEFSISVFFSFLDHHIDHGQEKRNFEDKEVRTCVRMMILLCVCCVDYSMRVRTRQ